MPIASTSTLQHSLLKSPQIQFAICPRHFIQNILPFEDSNCQFHLSSHSVPQTVPPSSAALTSTVKAKPVPKKQQLMVLEDYRTNLICCGVSQNSRSHHRRIHCNMEGCSEDNERRICMRHKREN
ncbi:hypothetical protein BT96DRAFT_1024992 [Gymnopus androsaceus JB14]|uniref:Uncharacterized protein n=1 Tax=Gymnopus androsaceus JB14 TaxID=1447944 RepID=A0A6A4GW01_9AGAR|nr:hypothetical protein BT96DRAFT_1024992 [Gymnopus androsaceus JB14]